MLAALAKRFEENLFDSVIPFWMDHSVDWELGGFFTCLERDGRIYDDRKYLWLNGRQLWTLSRLHNEAPTHPDRHRWLAAARRAAAFLRRHARDAEGRCYFALTRDGRPAAYQRKPYAAVFLCIGYHEYFKATGEEWALAEARDLFARIRHWIANPAAMGRPVLAGAPPLSQLADVMVQISIALELGRSDPDPIYRDVLASCLQQALDAHYFPDRGIFLENVAPSGEKLLHLPEGRLFCPGHSAEVCWFLLDVLDLLPDPSRQARVLDILEASLEQGWDSLHGGLFYFLDVAAKPTLQLEASMKLWWPHTEAYQALIYALTRAPQPRFERWLDRIVHYTFSTFPDPEFGEWFGYCDRSNQPTHTLKGNNYKGCFHVPRSLWLSLQRIRAAS